MTEQKEPRRRQLTFDLPDDPQEAELLAWWLQTAHDDFQKTTGKIYEYGATHEASGGSTDLMVLGYSLATLLEARDVLSPATPLSDALSQEVACWFFASSKLARLINDYRRGKPGKQDSIFDAHIYLWIMRRLQSAGRWP